MAHALLSKKFLLVMLIISQLTLFLFPLRKQIAHGDYTTCLLQYDEHKQRCLEQAGRGPDADYDGGCDEHSFASELCACLWGVESCGSNLEMEDLKIRIGRAIELEYELSGKEFSLPDHLKNFYLPVDDLKVLDGKDYDPNNTKIKHFGIDLGAIMGTEIYAVNEGVIEYAGPYGTYGDAVVINHGNGIYTVYGHIDLGGITVREGDLVHAGSQIGVFGNTGASTGPHLHFELRNGESQIDPKQILIEYMTRKTEDTISDRIRERFEEENKNNFSSDNFDTQKLLEVGNNVVNLNFTLPMQYESLSEEQKQEVVFEAAKAYAMTNGFYDDDVKNKNHKASAYAMENIMGISPSEAYALYMLSEEFGDQFTRSDLFKDFEDMYIPDSFKEPRENSDGIGDANNKLDFEKAAKFDTERPYKDGEAYNPAQKFEKFYEQYLYLDSYYDSEQAECTMTIPMSKTNLMGSASMAQTSTVSLHKETVGTGADAVEILVMTFKDGDLPPYSFAVTQDEDSRYTEFKNKRGVNIQGEQITGDSITLGGQTYYPMTDKGIVGMIHMKSMMKTFSNPEKDYVKIMANKKWDGDVPKESSKK